MPNVKITVTNAGTGIVSNSTTDSVGNYTIPNLPPGTFLVEAEAAGFKKFVRQNVNLEMTRQLRIDIPLETGTATETVNVEATTPLVETETGQLSTTVATRELIALPSIGRNPQDFRLLVPGIAQNRDGNTVTQGGLVRKDPYYIDGAHSSNHVWSGNPVNPNPDVVDEFKVLTNSFSAEYGESSGGVMTSTTKSGTNAFHGSLFEFLRNDKLNAGNYYTHTVPVIKRNQYGGTIGGPVIKNRTFFFFDIQFTKQRSAQAFNNLSVPTPAFKAGNFSSILGPQVGTDALGRAVFRNQIFDPLSGRNVTNASGQSVLVRDAFPNNTIPANRLSPAALNIQKLFPDPQINADFANYTAFGSVKDDPTEWDLKGDHNFSSNDKIMARYSFRKTDQVPPQPFPNPNAGGGVPGVLGQGIYTRNSARQAVFNHIHIFGPRMTNSFHLGWFQTYPKRPVPGFGEVSTNSLGIMGLPNGDDKLGTPDFQWTNFARLGATSDTLFFELQDSKSLVNVTSLMLARHNIRFGGEVRKIRTDNLQPNPGTTLWRFQPIFTDQRGINGTGFDYASFLLGLPAQMGYRIFPGFFKSRTSVYALFVQDDIRLSRKLTLNLGLRWDAPLYYNEAQNRSGVFDLNKGEYIQFGTNGFRNTPWKNDWNNFGPRFGFAYSPFGDNRTVIRGGYGIFAVGTMSSGAFGFMQSDPIFADADVGRYNTLDQVTWRTTLDRVPYAPADKTGRNATAVSIYPDDNPMSYFQQWNFNIQREIKQIMVEVGYAGSKGSHLHYGAYNANAIPVNLAPQAQGRRIAPFIPYPQYPGGVTSQSWIGSSNYNSFQMKAERRFASGLGFLTSFTWQKLMNVGEQGWRDPVGNRQLDRGISPDSAPYRLTSGFSYTLPFGKGHKWAQGPVADAVIGGWELNGIVTFQAGFPLTPGVSIDTCACANNLNVPNILRNPNLNSSERSTERFFDTSAFATPALYTIGNSGRGVIWGPGQRNFDFVLGKRFHLDKIREGTNLQVRGEFYNFTNTPYFANPNVTIGSATVGRITSVSNSPRQLQLAMRLQF
ncbi:MAG: carboxypeptidase regulatory-like domain-containing protein [Bryobacterales bacterium]|nr:carboxypeptidase regulatory-like domain-containing protein [Bryobacterales bacterium]